MDLLIECVIKLVTYIVAAVIIAGILRYFLGKTLALKLFVWLSPGIMVVILGGYINGRTGGAGWMKLTILFGMLILIANFVIVGKRLMTQLQQIADELMKSTDKMNSASALVSNNTGSLAEGGASQAAAIEESSSSLEEMAAMTRGTANNANQAKNLMAETRAIVAKVNEHMNNMAEAIRKVTKTSEATGKIIKTIDEIAFKTNLLALNAAVEAARAGVAGAGFAVVADEVRNLAKQSAEAAKNTATLIENTIAVIKESSDLTQLTQKVFAENVEIATKVEDLVKEIAAASDDQANGINQINKAVADLDRIIQQNASSAEESAGAAQELNAQSTMMKRIVQRLIVIIQGQADELKEIPSVARVRVHTRTVVEAPKARVQTRAFVAAPKALRNAPVKLLPSSFKKPASGHARSREVRPEEVIPFENDEFKDL